MIAQYTQAAMVAENRRLAAPASVDSLPTSAMQEDHVSMGWGAARKLRAVVDNLARILAVELVCAARGLELRAPLEPGRGTGGRAAPPCAARGRRRARPLAGARARGGRALVALGRGCSRAVEVGDRERCDEPAPRPSARRAAPSSPAAAGRRRRRCGC